MTGQNLFLIVSLLPSAILKTHLFANVQNFFVLLVKMNNCSVPYLFNSELTKNAKRGQEVSFLVTGLGEFKSHFGVWKNTAKVFSTKSDLQKVKYPLQGTTVY